MFGILLLSSVTLMHLYLCARIGSLPWVRRLAPGWALLAIAILLWAAAVIGRTWGHGGVGPLARGVEWFGMLWLAVLFINSVPMLAVDLLTGFGWWLRRWAPRLRSAALAVGAVFSVIAGVQGGRAPAITPHEVTLPGLPAALDGTVAIVLSDLHLDGQLDRAWLAGRIDQVQAEHPDLILLLGDIFEGHDRPRPELLDEVRRLSAPLGVWGVLGNHEFFGGDAGTARAFAAAGVRLLRNRAETVAPGLVLAGVDDLTTWSRRGLPGDPVAAALAARPPGAAILLSHSPWEADTAAAAGAGLMLSGHTHGGQIWPFGYVVRLFYPLDVGRHEIDGMTMLVSRGTGLWGPRMRLWQPGEILRITLRAPAEEHP